MGSKKQKWSSEEEQAVKDGVAKHGVRKWQKIKNDPEYSAVLDSRSNVDIKDKWRTLSGRPTSITIAPLPLGRRKLHIVRRKKDTMQLRDENDEECNAHDSALNVITNAPLPLGSSPKSTSRPNNLISEGRNNLKEPTVSYKTATTVYSEARSEKENRLIGASEYEPLHRQSYSQLLSAIDPSLSKAITEGSKVLRSIMSEPSGGIFTFQMFEPQFCEKLLDEVQNFEKWGEQEKYKISRPTIIHKYGFRLDELGLKSMVDNLMDKFLIPISKACFPDFKDTLDSCHGFIVEFKQGKDLESCFHVDDSEVTVNVCLGSEFSGGDLFFRGIRCDKHVDSKTHRDEMFEYSQVPGHAIIHRGRHRHGAKCIESGYRISLVLWCRGSNYRESSRSSGVCNLVQRVHTP